MQYNEWIKSVYIIIEKINTQFILLLNSLINNHVFKTVIYLLITILIFTTITQILKLAFLNTERDLEEIKTTKSARMRILTKQKRDNYFKREYERDGKV